MKKPLILLAAALLQACAHNPPVSKYTAISPSGVDLLRGKSIHIKAAPTPDMVQTTTGDQATMTVGMLFGAIGGGVGAAVAMSHAKSRGHALMVENEIPDPTPILKQRVEAMLVAKYGSTVGDVGYEVEVATKSWALLKDNVVFTASVKLTDGAAPDPQIFALGECRYTSQTDPSTPPIEALLDHHAEKLKELLRKALEQCVQDFDQKVFI